jgi:AbrB family looped-hinge helix DNA binding protein
MEFTGEQIMTIVKVSRQFQVTIPVEVREQLGIGKGDILEAAVQGDAVIFKPKVLLDRKTMKTTSHTSQPSASRKGR